MSNDNVAMALTQLVDDARRYREAVDKVYLNPDETLHDRIITLEERVVKLSKELVDGYSTDTHILMSHEQLEELISDFEFFDDEVNSLESQFDSVQSYASDIESEASNDAYSVAAHARACKSRVRDLLNSTETAEV
jgi:hypothetical protein